ncbi:MAG: hypothetical protein KGI14_09370, partial [Acidobacteriota bacterium]|nr:hypothetical protein [Acidobacteriota bacterium]
MTRDRDQLRDEITLREASLEDARRERDRGELSDQEFDAIDQRERRALHEARAALSALETADVAPARASTPRRRRRGWLVVALG